MYLTAGVDYEPVNVRLTFTPSIRSQTVDIVTIQDTIFEVVGGEQEQICLRLTNLTEPCPGSVIIGPDTMVTITEDDRKFVIWLYFY